MTLTQSPEIFRTRDSETAVAFLYFFSVLPWVFPEVSTNSQNTPLKTPICPKTSSGYDTPACHYLFPQWGKVVIILRHQTCVVKQHETTTVPNPLCAYACACTHMCTFMPILKYVQIICHCDFKARSSVS